MVTAISFVFDFVDSLMLCGLLMKYKRAVEVLGNSGKLLTGMLICFTLYNSSVRVMIAHIAAFPSLKVGHLPLRL